MIFTLVVVVVVVLIMSPNKYIKYGFARPGSTCSVQPVHTALQPAALASPNCHAALSPLPCSPCPLPCIPASLRWPSAGLQMPPPHADGLRWPSGRFRTPLLTAAGLRWTVGGLRMPPLPAHGLQRQDERAFKCSHCRLPLPCPDCCTTQHHVHVDYLPRACKCYWNAPCSVGQHCWTRQNKLHSNSAPSS